ncbi:MAG: polysaccharide pyruvyl transferase family protein [Bacteroidales bacterium]|nr:polysaccharide pyruvyl transferase family protein [Bacteroidales bacterium]
MNICQTDKCTGCGACINACPKLCIAMHSDMYGEIHPKIDKERCIECGLCAKICPNNAPIELQMPTECYAAWLNDDENRKVCASGGLATAFAEYIIKQGGIVFGTAYDNSLTPRMTWIDKVEDVQKFKGSKYVQSIIDADVFRTIKKFLDAGRRVLCIATPCQIAGLKSFLRKEYDNLIVVDLICHGVCPTTYLAEEVSFLAVKHNLRDITNIRFRGNDGNNFRFTLWNGNDRLYYGNDVHNYYLAGFIKGVTLRENCYKCQYAKPERVGDITIGDFIGLGQKTPFGYDAKNVSCVMVNTQRGKTFYEKVLQSNSMLKSVLRSYEERQNYRLSILEPFPRHKSNAKFRELYSKYGFHAAMAKCIGGDLLKYEIKVELKKNPIRAIPIIMRRLIEFYKECHSPIKVSKKKKVCLVTWLGTGNFGTSLQSFALHKYLENIGFDVELLMPFSEDDFSQKSALRKKYKRLKTILYNTLKSKKRPSQSKLAKFNRENYNIRRICSRSGYRNLITTTDVFVTGSDQIWNCYHSFSPFMFLSFAKARKRVAYASSIGTKGFPEQYQDAVKGYLSKFAHIGVREIDAVDTIRQLTGRNDVVQVLDPTFLISSSEWHAFADKAHVEISLPERFAVCYFIGNNDYWQAAKDIAHSYNIEMLIAIPSLENNSIPHGVAQIYADAGPYEFVELIRKSSLVLTDSFHACALSINMSKQFVAFKRFADSDAKSQNSRIYNLLEHYGVYNRLYEGKTLSGEIEFTEVQEILARDREFSSSWLTSSIEN